MAQWQNQNISEILSDKGYNWYEKNEFLWSRIPINIYNCNMPDLFLILSKQKTLTDIQVECHEMAKQEALTLMPKFD